MKFQVVGADRQTGHDVEIVVEARDEVDAETIANGRNIIVSSVGLLRLPGPDHQPSPPVAPQKGGKAAHGMFDEFVRGYREGRRRETASANDRLSQIEQQIKALGETDTFGTKKEIKYLPNILTEDETILALTSGLMDGNTWLIVCTEKRVVFLDKGMIYGLKQRETPLERINSIEQKTGLVFGSIGIWDGASLMEIKNVMKNTVRPFVEAVNRARDALKSAEGRNRSSAGTSGADLASQLERLADLRDRGILTDEEFQTQKTKILGA